MIDFNMLIIPFGLISLLLVLGLFITAFRLNKKFNLLAKENKELQDENLMLFRQRKSSEIRLGRIGENMAPFFEEWPYDPNDFRFLGSPIDGVQFTEGSIIFVEIKTGKSRLTGKQRMIRDLVKNGRVSFATFRVDEDGCTMTLEGEDKEESSDFSGLKSEAGSEGGGSG